MKQKTITEQEFFTITQRLGHVERETNNEPIGYEIERVKYTHWGEYVYYADFVVSFGARVARPGDTVTVARLWADDELIYDRRAGFIKPQIGFTFFDGREDQGEVYRGMHYRGQMVGRFIDFRLTDYGNNIPSITAELVDGDGAAIADAVGAFQPIMTTGAYVQLDPERDTMFTAGQYTLRPDMIHYRTGYAGSTESWNLAATEARLSTKNVYKYNAVVGVLGAALDDVWYEGGTITWLPEINRLVAQPAQGSRQPKRLVNLAEKFAPTIAETELVTEWDMAIKLVVRHGTQSYYFVAGASETTVAPVLVDDTIIGPVSEVETSGGISCLIPGKQRASYTDYYVIQATEVLRCGQWFHGGSNSTETLYTPPSGHTLTQGWYDKATDRLVVLVESDAGAHTGYAVAINADGSVAWESDTIHIPVKTPRHYTQESYSDTSNGSIVLVRQDDPAKLTYLHLASGAVSEITLFAPPANFPLDETTVWDSRTETLYSGAQSFVQIGTPPAPGNENSLTAGEVMTAYAVHVGFDIDNISTVNMDGLFIQGYVVSGDTTLAQLATNLGSLYGFNWVERNNEIIFKSIYTDEGEIIIDETIPANRLAVLDEGNPDHFTVERETPRENAPSVVSLTYFDPDNQLRSGMQVAERDSDALLDNRIDFSYPLTIDGQYALELLFGYMARVWSSTTSYSIRLPAEGIALDPIDVIEFTANGFDYTAQVTRHRINADYSVSISAVEASAKYPVPAEAQPPRVIPSTGLYPPRVTILDAPLTTPFDEREGYVRLMAFVSGVNGAPLGPTIFEMAYASGAPAEWEPRATLGSADAGNVGTLVMPVGPTDDPFTLDTYNEIFVAQESIDPAKFVAATDADLDNGANLIAIGSGAEVEYVQFKSAQEVEPGVWRLYNLRRGRFGTEVFIYVGAQAGSIPVTFIDDKAIAIEISYADLAAGYTYQFRAYTPGQPLWQVDTVTHTPVGNSRRAYAPAIIEGFVEEDDDIRFTWKRRARYFNIPPIPVEALPFPLDELAEEYAVELYDADTLEFIRRYNGVYEQAFTWPALDQSFEGYTPGDIDKIVAKVIQVSPVSGDGFSMSYVVHLVPADAVLLSAKFDLGGEMTLGTANYILLSATFDMGGEMRAHMYPPLRLSATFGLEGGMTANIFGPVELAAHIVLGGEMTANMDPVPVRLGATFDLEGVMVANISGRGEIGAVFSLGGSMTANILAPVRLSASFGLGGEMTADIAEVAEDPYSLSASFELGGGMRANLATATQLNPAWLDWATQVLFSGNPDTGLVEQLAGDPGTITYVGTPIITDDGWIYLNHQDDGFGASGDDYTDRFYWTPPTGQNARTTPSSDWTLEFWIKDPLSFLGTNRQPGLIGRSTGNNSTAWYTRHFTGTDTLSIHRGSSANMTKVGGDVPNLEDGGEHHVAYVKIGNNMRLYIDGVDQGVVANIGGFGDASNALLVGGGAAGFITKYRAHADAIRLSNIARYTENFVPTPRRSDAEPSEPAEGHYRYYRLYIEAVGSGQIAQIANLELYETPLGPNVIEIPIGRSDSVQSEFVASWGMDGNLMELSATNSTHKWQSTDTALPHWLGVDLITPRKIEAFGITNSRRPTEGVNRRPVTFKLQASNDGSTWTDLASRSNYDWGTKGHERFLCDGVASPTTVGSPHGAHKVWRLYFTKKQDGQDTYPFSAASIEFRAIPGGTDQAAGAGGIATAHSQLDSNEIPDKAFDGNPSTIWGSADQGNYNTSWIQYEFPNPVTVAEFVYKVRPDFSFTQQTPKDMQLMYADDPNGPFTTAWGAYNIPAFTAYGQEFASTDPAYSGVTIEPANKRYWRIHITEKAGTGLFINVGELEFSEVFGSPVDGNDTTLGMTAIGSTAFSGNYAPIFVFDDSYSPSSGSGSNRYFSSPQNAQTAWLGVDYGVGNEKEIVEVRMMCDRDPAQTPKNFSVESSLDGISWKTEWEVTNQVDWTIGEWRTFRDPSIPVGGEVIPDTYDTVQPTVVGTSTWADTGLTAQLPKPSGLAVGDLLIVHHSGVTYPDIPAGWSRVIVGGNIVLYRFADAADVAASTIDLPNVNTVSKFPAVMTVVRDADPINPITAATINLVQGRNAFTQPVTAAGDNRLLVCSFRAQSSENLLTGSSSNLGNTVTASALKSDGHSFNIRLFMGSREVDTGSHTGAFAGTGDQASNSGIVAVAVLVKGKPTP